MLPQKNESLTPKVAESTPKVISQVKVKLEDKSTKAALTV